MRVLQIIDSLEAGGAERMAVNFANALGKTIDFSGLVATRKEGSLKTQIDSDVSYLFLNRKLVIDFKAILKLRKFIIKNKVAIIHAHSSSFFIAVLLKLTLPKIKITWHDHYGKRIDETQIKNRYLILLSPFFSSVFVVNPLLEQWNKKNMLCSNVCFIPNFIKIINEVEKDPSLKGVAGKRILFLANLKEPKNHSIMLKAFENLKLNHLGWSLHLIGKDYLDDYSKSIKIFIKKHALENDIHLYDSRSDITSILAQGTIGVLTSTAEGFPLTLLEYGLASLPVVSTNTGYCSSIINNNNSGLLFNPLQTLDLENQIIKLILDEELRNELGLNLKKTVLENYVEDAVIQKLISAYNRL